MVSPDQPSSPLQQPDQNREFDYSADLTPIRFEGLQITVGNSGIIGRSGRIITVASDGAWTSQRYHGQSQALPDRTGSVTPDQIRKIVGILTAYNFDNFADTIGKSHVNEKIVEVAWEGKRKLAFASINGKNLDVSDEGKAFVQMASRLLDAIGTNAA